MIYTIIWTQIEHRSKLYDRSTLPHPTVPTADLGLNGRLFKGTIPPWKKLLNMSELYAKMLRTFYLTCL